MALIVLCLGIFAVLLDATIVNVALPSAITGPRASPDQALWVVSAYLLVFAALVILGSRLGDMFGGCSSRAWRCSRWPLRRAGPRGHRAS